MDKRKWILLFVVLCLGMAACSLDDQPKASTEGMVQTTEATESIEPTEPAGPLVTDAWASDCSCGTTITGKEYSYAIPQINLDSSAAALINGQIMDKYSCIVHNCEETGNEYAPKYFSVAYEYSVVGDVLSLRIEDDPADLDDNQYTVYTISIAEKAEADKEDIVETAGMAYDDYLMQVKHALVSEFWNMHESFYSFTSTNLSLQVLKTIDDDLQKTLSADNLEAAIPYFDKNGNLCILGKYYINAAAGYMRVSVNLETFEMSPYYAETVEYPREQMRIELTWDRVSDVSEECCIGYLLMGIMDDGQTVYVRKNQNEVYAGDVLVATVEDISTQEKEGSCITLYRTDGVFSMTASAEMGKNGMIINGLIMNSGIEAVIDWADQNQSVIYSYSDEDVYRGGTGVWYWAPFNIDHGVLTDYSGY